ncbi:MAG TPA: hypothetical protein VEU27_09380 [Gemmatimonadales bacterium]|nr:hypothetical protein [Gemmatimonadales bacterium]
MAAVTEILSRIYPVLLFLHLVAVVAGFSGAALMHFGLGRMRGAETADRALDGARIVGRIGPLMPLVSLALFVTGACLTVARWSWQTSWIAVAIVGLVAMLVISAALLKPRMAALAPRLARAGGARVEGELAAGVQDPALRIASQLQPFLALGIMFVMVTKPGLAGGAAALVVAAAAAVVTAGPQRSLALGGDGLETPVTQAE